MANDTKPNSEIIYLRKRVSDLVDEMAALKAEFQAFKNSILPKCHKCGAPAGRPTVPDGAVGINAFPIYRLRKEASWQTL